MNKDVTSTVANTVLATVNTSMYRSAAVDWFVFWAVDRDVRGTVFGATGREMKVVVSDVQRNEPNHPALQDFLSEGR
jgi:hypothetical protein